MSNCYTFKKLKYNSGIFDSSIDITYIMTMENSERIINITNQLNKLKPTSNIILVINKGFKKCKKNLPIQNSVKDIIHANIEIFNHAKKNNYNNILIFEDDFEFDKNLFNYTNIFNVNTICNDYKNTKFCLSLGSIPLLIFPYNYCLYKSIASMGTHSMIYTKKSREYILSFNNLLDQIDWDIFTNLYSNKYCYYLPLITQTFPETINQKNWTSAYGLKQIAIQAIKNNDLDKKTQPGFNNIYKIMKIINLLLIFLLLLILLYIIYSLKK